jgi:hypothetical protein
MQSRRSILGLGIAAALGYYAYEWIGQNVEVVTLHATSAHEHYAKLFVVDDPPWVWIRAERPNRLWLASVRENPEVTVLRGDREIAYHAEVWNGEGEHNRIDELFRAKYGLFDRLSAWIWRRDAVPVRLEPRDPFAGA